MRTQYIFGQSVVVALPSQSLLGLIACLFLAAHSVAGQHGSDLSRLPTEQRAWIERTCPKQLGPTLYFSCVDREASALQSGLPDLSRLSSSDRGWIEQTCSRSLGPKLYIDCVKRELSSLSAHSPKSSPPQTESKVPEHFTGKELSEFCGSTNPTYNAVCLGYAKAISDELTLLSITPIPGVEGVRLNCNPPPYDDAGLLAVMRKQLLDHPEKLSDDGPGLTDAALTDPLACTPGPPQDGNVSVYATAEVLASACRNNDQIQRAQCLGYLQAAYDYDSRIFDSPMLKAFFETGACKKQVQGFDQLKATFLQSVGSHPEYLKLAATRVLYITLAPPAPCPLAPT
jgi:hypothetical protein